jgi:hypothetical protein
MQQLSKAFIEQAYIDIKAFAGRRVDHNESLRNLIVDWEELRMNAEDHDFQFNSWWPAMGEWLQGGWRQGEWTWPRRVDEGRLQGEWRQGEWTKECSSKEGGARPWHVMAERSSRKRRPAG